jgi:Asp-tRNA(Asn)/Glu-tRNA(Gln) amidotransferase A subunit family amidase
MCICADNPDARALKRGETVDDHMALYLSDIFTVTANLAGIPPWRSPRE